MLKKFKIGMLSLFWSVATFASTNSKMVWESPADEISKSISGPMAKVIALVVIVASAFGWVLTQDSGIMGKIIRIVVALAVVGGASVLLGLFNITGGVMIG
ncbi:conjugal transfer protein TrbC [Fusobacterium necrogenes]|uniref:Conjugal transfer protein TrbC n=1 Tax=Fusobacterium necrogenes TaxID=858 RepID=A0A377GNV8_9FUSO|nr:TrbC/VirB2 family protein [Fusobacterium necrogenes]STO26895.1 conjugal transfer protein TrbC [Fusobacterium necrogenes]